MRSYSALTPGGSFQRVVTIRSSMEGTMWQITYGRLARFAAVAPLLCAGITTYSPLRHWNAGPGKKVWSK